MSGADGNQIEFRTDRVSSRQLVRQAWRILWPEYFWIMLAICLVGLIVASVASPFLMGPMMCGIFICCFAMMRNERPTFDMLFKGFDMFVDSLVATLIMVGVSLLLLIPLFLLMFGGMIAVVGMAGEQAGDAAAGGMMIFFLIVYLAFFLITVVVQILFIFSYQLIVDYNLTGVDAVKLSARAAWANLGNILRLTILFWLISTCALILCYLPILLVIPVNFLAQALLYRRVFPDRSADSQQYDSYADPYADPHVNPHANPQADVGGYQLDDGVSETGPGAGSGSDIWE